MVLLNQFVPLSRDMSVQGRCHPVSLLALVASKSWTLPTGGWTSAAWHLHFPALALPCTADRQVLVLSCIIHCSDTTTTPAAASPCRRCPALCHTNTLLVQATGFPVLWHTYTHTHKPRRWLAFGIAPLTVPHTPCHARCVSNTRCHLGLPAHAPAVACAPCPFGPCCQCLSCVHSASNVTLPPSCCFQASFEHVQFTITLPQMCPPSNRTAFVPTASRILCPKHPRPRCPARPLCTQVGLCGHCNRWGVLGRA